MTLKEIELEYLVPSPTNPRKRFGAEDLQELAASIAAVGVMQPLVVRPLWCVGCVDQAAVAARSKDEPLAEIGGRFEIVAGERRFHGSKQAGKTSAPCVVREISDSDALELQFVENLQRADLSIREEAEGYRRLLELRNDDGSPRFTLSRLADRIGKTLAYVEQRVKLLNLPAEAFTSAEQGVLSFSHLRLIARIPNAAHRAKALEEILHPTFSAVPMTVREAAEWIRRTYQVELRKPAFSLEAADLVPLETDEAGNRVAGGACSDCPFLTSNNPEEFPEAGGQKLCTNPTCYAAKVEASWEAARSEALKAGKRVLSDEEAEKLFSPHSGDLAHNSPYVRLADQVGAEDVRAEVKRPPSWKKIVTAIPEKPVTVLRADRKHETLVEVPTKLARPEILVARDARGNIHELVRKSEALAAYDLAVKHANVPAVFRDNRRAGAAEQDAAASAEKERKRIEQAAAMRGMTDLHKAIANQGFVPRFWATLLELVIDYASADARWWAVKRLGIEAPKCELHGGRDYAKALRDHWEGVGDKQAAAAVLELLLGGNLKFQGLTAEPVEPWLKLYGLDAKAIAAAVKAETKKGAKKPAPEQDDATAEAAAQLAAAAESSAGGMVSGEIPAPGQVGPLETPPAEPAPLATGEAAVEELEGRPFEIFPLGAEILGALRFSPLQSPRFKSGLNCAVDEVLHEVAREKIGTPRSIAIMAELARRKQAVPAPAENCPILTVIAAAGLAGLTVAEIADQSQESISRVVEWLSNEQRSESSRVSCLGKGKARRFVCVPAEPQGAPAVAPGHPGATQSEVRIIELTGAEVGSASFALALKEATIEEINQVYADPTLSAERNCALRAEIERRECAADGEVPLPLPPPPPGDALLARARAEFGEVGPKSIAELQRRLKLGYVRAKALFAEIEAAKGSEVAA